MNLKKFFLHKNAESYIFIKKNLPKLRVHVSLHICLTQPQVTKMWRCLTKAENPQLRLGRLLWRCPMQTETCQRELPPPSPSPSPSPPTALICITTVNSALENNPWRVEFSHQPSSNSIQITDHLNPRCRYYPWFCIESSLVRPWQKKYSYLSIPITPTQFREVNEEAVISHSTVFEDIASPVTAFILRYFAGSIFPENN